ncbi:MAG TPA: hypothetical protein VGO11_00180 [Chthoniobacteraceae bacterium]|jgi:hypothetical protein|nr:hypothetical protein [Chthoniobacteraceae bacterium]
MKLLPFLVRAVAVVLFASSLPAVEEPLKKEAPAWAAGWKVVKIAIPKTGQIEHAFVDLLTPAGRAFTLSEGVLNKEAGVALEKVEWTGSPVHAKVLLRKENEQVELSADAGLVSRDDALERRLSQVQIEAKFIEMPDAIAKEMLPGLKEALAAPPGGKPQVGMLLDAHLEELVRSLNQKKGVDLLSAPRLSANSGQNATIEIIREFRYATDWERDQKGKQWAPTAFETQNVGVTLEVTATVNHDGTLDLDLVPQVVEFLGFVEAGTQKVIAAAKPDAKESLGKRLLEPPAKGNANDNERKTPIFATRKTRSGLTMRAGQSVLLLLEDSEETKPFVSPHAGKTLVAIVTAGLVAPVEGLASPPAPPMPAPPVSPNGDAPVAVPIPGKKGFVRSPHLPEAGYIDVRGFAPGTVLQDPYSRGKLFRVP